MEERRNLRSNRQITESPMPSDVRAWTDIPKGTTATAETPSAVPLAVPIMAAVGGTVLAVLLLS